MSSTHETGHAKNVANLETMITFCTSYGGQYNPTNPLIVLPNLNNKYTDGVNSLATVNTALAPWQNTVNDRERLFEPFSRLCTKILNAVEASAVTEQYMKDVKTIIRKLQGKRATPKKKDEPTTPENESEQSHSASQMSYDQRIENFDKLIDLLASNPNYNPNEPDVRVPDLTNLRSQMVTANTAVKTAYTGVSNARIARNVVLYDPTNGLVRTAEDVKKYIKSVFGGASDQYRQVSSLKFTTPKK